MDAKGEVAGSIIGSAVRASAGNSASVSVSATGGDGGGLLGRVVSRTQENSRRKVQGEYRNVRPFQTDQVDIDNLTILPLPLPSSIND